MNNNVAYICGRCSQPVTKFYQTGTNNCYQCEVDINNEIERKDKMHEELLILTVGLPQSGKTTWAKKQNIPIVNPDSIRLALHGKAFIPEAEDFVWTIAYTMAKALFLAGHTAVIIDATNITEKRRHAWVERFPSKKVVYKLFPTDWEICIDRAKSTSREDLIPIIKSMEIKRVAECHDRPVFVDVPVNDIYQYDQPYEQGNEL